MYFIRRRPNDRSWGVAATVREPVALVKAFVAHHLALGADRVTLYFDDPKDRAAEALSGIDKVEVVRCSPGYWRRQDLRHGRPEPKTERQVANIRRSHRRADVAWLIHIDADEFLHLPNGIGPSLAALTPDTSWVRIPVAERFWPGGTAQSELFGGRFRTPLAGPRAVTQVYGPDQDHLFPAGMAGHAAGKPLMPTGTRDRPRLHMVWHQTEPESLPHGTAPDAMVLHFEGLTPRHWALKHLRQALVILQGAEAMRPERRAVTQAIMMAEDPLGAALSWFERSHVVPPEAERRLDRRKAVRTFELGIADAVARFFPGDRVDLTRAAIDAGIEAELQATLAELKQRRTGWTDPGPK